MYAMYADRLHSKFGTTITYFLENNSLFMKALEELRTFKLIEVSVDWGYLLWQYNYSI